MDMKPSKKSVKRFLEKNNTKKKNINKLIKLSLSYIDRLGEAEKAIPLKIKYVRKFNYEKASIERKRELTAYSDANAILKKMKAVRELIMDDKTK